MDGKATQGSYQQIKMTCKCGQLWTVLACRGVEGAGREKALGYLLNELSGDGCKQRALARADLANDSQEHPLSKEMKRSNLVS